FGVLSLDFGVLLRRIEKGSSSRPSPLPLLHSSETFSSAPFCFSFVSRLFFCNAKRKSKAKAKAEIDGTENIW
ncbi:hypothetical protein Dimus_004351, partial [Dionaea muscipula]